MTYEQQKPMISIIVPTYNRAHLLSRAIQSILSQSYLCYEVLIVDDNSTDNTTKIVQQFADERIRYFQNETNLGVSATRNKGIVNALGKYVTFLDDDDEYGSSFLKKTVGCMESCQEDIGFCWSGYQHVQDTSEGEVFLKERVFKKNPNNKLQYTSSSTGYGLTIRRKCFDQIGLFDEKLRAVVDVDILFRLGEHYDYLIIPEPLIIKHHHSGDQLTNVNKQRAECLKLVIMKYLHVLNEHPACLIEMCKKSAEMFYQIDDKTNGRAMIRLMLKTNPIRLKSWKSLFCLESFGTEQLGLRMMLSLNKFRGFKN